jgi:hypothetical protein
MPNHSLSLSFPDTPRPLVLSVPRIGRPSFRSLLVALGLLLQVLRDLEPPRLVPLGCLLLKRVVSTRYPQKYDKPCQPHQAAQYEDDSIFKTPLPPCGRDGQGNNDSPTDTSYTIHITRGSMPTHILSKLVHHWQIVCEHELQDPRAYKPRQSQQRWQRSSPFH